MQLRKTLTSYQKRVNDTLNNLNPVLLISLAATVIPVYAILWIIRRYSYNFPFGDDWALVIRLYTNDPPLWEFWHFYNQHRVFIPQVMMFIIARLTEMDFRVYLYIDLAYAFGTVYLLYRIFRHTSGIKMAYVMLPVFSILYISLGSYTNWITSPTFPNWTSTLYCIGGVWVAACWKPGWRSLIMGAGFSYLASLSLFYGNFVWFIVPLGWFLRGYRMQGWRQYVVWSLLAASVLLPYVWEYTVIIIPTLKPVPLVPVDVIHYALTLIGGSISGPEPYPGLTSAAAVGIVGIVSLAVLIILGLMVRNRVTPTADTQPVLIQPELPMPPITSERVFSLFGGTLRFSITTSNNGKRNGEIRVSRVDNVLPWFLIALHVILIAFSAAVGRVGELGVLAARSERYNPISSLFWISVVALLACLLFERRQWFIRLGAIALLMFISIGFLHRQFNVVLYATEVDKNISTAHDCLVRYFEELASDKACVVAYGSSGIAIDNISNELLDLARVRVGWMVPRQFEVRKAVVDPPDATFFETRVIDDSPIPLIFAHAPSRIDWTYTVPKGKKITLRTGVMVDIPAVYIAPQSDGVLFEITALFGSESRSLYRAQVAPRVPGQGFAPVTVDLTPLAGKEIHLVLTTKAGEALDAKLNYDWALWLPLDVTVTN